mmetsp:Transcript_45646/g.141089  ORF Transcript_45646/g.141089 Transcript_45646/m.141089 type:complete len:486 (-) Transcript_45646:944-2401(-)
MQASLEAVFPRVGKLRAPTADPLAPAAFGNSIDSCVLTAASVDFIAPAGAVLTDGWGAGAYAGNTARRRFNVSTIAARFGGVPGHKAPIRTVLRALIAASWGNAFSAVAVGGRRIAAGRPLPPRCGPGRLRGALCGIDLQGFNPLLEFHRAAPPLLRCGQGCPQRLGGRLALSSHALVGLALPLRLALRRGLHLRREGIQLLLQGGLCAAGALQRCVPLALGLRELPLECLGIGPAPRQFLEQCLFLHLRLLGSRCCGQHLRVQLPVGRSESGLASLQLRVGNLEALGSRLPGSSSDPTLLRKLLHGVLRGPKACHLLGCLAPLRLRRLRGLTPAARLALCHEELCAQARYLRLRTRCTLRGLARRLPQRLQLIPQRHTQRLQVASQVRETDARTELHGARVGFCSHLHAHGAQGKLQAAEGLSGVLRRRAHADKQGRLAVAPYRAIEDPRELAVAHRHVRPPRREGADHIAEGQEALVDGRRLS